MDTWLFGEEVSTNVKSQTGPPASVPVSADRVIRAEPPESLPRTPEEPVRKFEQGTATEILLQSDEALILRL